MKHLAQLFFAALLLAAVSGGAGAQVVVSSQALDFGEIIAGVPEVVQWSDVIRRADIEIQGTTNSTASLSLVLPMQLQASSGATIPLQFQAGDVVYQGPVGGNVTVNLNAPTPIRLHQNKPGHLYIGGRALPAVGQSAGSYSATVIVVVAPPGA